MPKKSQVEEEVIVNEEILDFSEVRPFEPLDSSVRYKVRVTNCDTGNAKTDTSKKVSNVELTIVAPEEVKVEVWEPDEETGELVCKGLSERTTKAAGRKLFRTFTLEAKALPFLYNFLKACDPDVELNEAFRYRPAEWIGSELYVKGTNEAYQEQVRLRPNNMYSVAQIEKK